MMDSRGSGDCASGLRPGAAVLVIGNEILSGRTEDKNIPYIARGLVANGIELQEVRVTPDIEARIIEDINALRKRYDYVFTTGGIGPTHDDITTESVAKALELPIVERKDVIANMEEHYKKVGQVLNDERRKMATTPEGAELILNPLSIAPGYRIENIFVMAGIPKIMQAMFDSTLLQLKGGKKIASITVHAACGEGDIAHELSQIQHQYPGIDIGSYPVFNEGAGGPATNLVARGDDEVMLTEVQQQLEKLVAKYTAC